MAMGPGGVAVKTDPSGSSQPRGNVRDNLAASVQDDFKGEDFASLLDETLGQDTGFDGSVVTGRVLRLTDEFVIVDIGLKSEGRVALREFGQPDSKPDVKPGDVIELYVERYEDKDGAIILSREKARREEAWTNLEKAFETQRRVNGTIYGRVKGGFTVDLGGAVAFLPGSQVDIRPVRDVGPLMGTPQPFQILKMDRARGNIVVSRRAVLEETRAEQRTELTQGLKEGQILDGVVTKITDYGAFVDLGGVDGLLHVTDIAWRHINHPSEALLIGQQVKVQVIRFNPETQRISLGMKHLEADPWEGVEEKYPAGAKFTGPITNITDYGAFVELETGIEGLVHVAEMSWIRKNVHPGEILSTGQEVDVIVLDVDASKRRILLGLNQSVEGGLPLSTEEFDELAAREDENAELVAAIDTLLSRANGLLAISEQASKMATERGNEIEGVLALLRNIRAEHTNP
jgi:small subunit ribosomal protein S1